MQAVKQFKVFGEQVKVLVSSEMGNGTLTVITQTCPPGGGPPPHLHEQEDEFFTVIDGVFDLLEGTVWHRLEVGQSVYSPRGTVHTFKNVGDREGTILVSISPGGLDHCLEALSPLRLPEDAAAIEALFDGPGIRLAPGPELDAWFARREQRMAAAA